MKKLLSPGLLWTALLCLLAITTAVTTAANAATDDQQAEISELDRQEAELRALYAAYEQGFDAARAGDYDTALREFRLAAEQGLDVAQYNLGILYYSGQGVRQDYHEAYRWIRKAAEQGHASAMYNLGVMHFNEQGVNPRWLSVWPLSLITRSSNFREAARWYEAAAHRDHAGAQYYLATLYRDGLGVEQNSIMAWKWAWAARENDFSAASELVASLTRQLSADELDQARTTYAEWDLNRSLAF